MHPDDVDSSIRAGKRRRIYTPAPEDRCELGRAHVERLIPHRDPFRFVDIIDAADLTNGAIAGRRRVDPADPIFAGHFPGDPIFPGVLQIEAIGQLGLCLFALKNGPSPGGVRALKLHHTSFLAPVRPGVEMHLLAREIACDDTIGIAEGQVLVDGVICCFAILEVYFVEKT